MTDSGLVPTVDNLISNVDARVKGVTMLSGAEMSPIPSPEKKITITTITIWRMMDHTIIHIFTMTTVQSVNKVPAYQLTMDKLFLEINSDLTSNQVCSKNESSFSLTLLKQTLQLFLDMTISHGEVRLEWECIDAIETTETTTTDTTTTTGTTTTTYYDYTTSGSTTTTDYTTPWDDSCHRHHAGHDEFYTQVTQAIYEAVQSERDAGLFSAARNDHFSVWLWQIFDIYNEDVTDEENPRKCLLEKVGDSPGDLTKDELGSDCALDIANGDIDNACAKLKSFFEWVYGDCKTEGVKILERLEFRCNRINAIKAEIAEKQEG